MFAIVDILTGNKGIIIRGGYKYSAGCYLDEKTNEIIIRLGCFHRTIPEWDTDFDNNIKEFPLNSLEREKRWEV